MRVQIRVKVLPLVRVLEKETSTQNKVERMAELVPCWDYKIFLRIDQIEEHFYKTKRNGESG